MTMMQLAEKWFAQCKECAGQKASSEPRANKCKGCWERFKEAHNA